MYTMSRSQVSLLSPTPGSLFSGMCKMAGRARIRSACSGKQLRPRTARWKPERTEGQRVGRGATRACAAGSDFTTGRKPARRGVVLATLSSEVWSRFLRAVGGRSGSRLGALSTRLPRLGTGNRKGWGGEVSWAQSVDEEGLPTLRCPPPLYWF